VKRYRRSNTATGRAPVAVPTTTSNDTAHPYRWAQLLEDAVNTPGTISRAYSTFWRYSTGNMLAALLQCQARGITPGPINTYAGWQALGRQVRKGEKAFVLCQPITATRRQSTDAEAADDAEAPDVYTFFQWRPRWFVLAQTDAINGKEYTPPILPGWDRARALEVLGVREERFTHFDGNVQGYSTAGRVLAISPVAAHPERTLLHELGHIVLGHLDETSRDLPRAVKEAEAESVTLICADALGIAGADESRGYIQHWLRSERFEEAMARRIFRAADAILKAGRDDPAPPLASAA